MNKILKPMRKFVIACAATLPLSAIVAAQPTRAETVLGIADTYLGELDPHKAAVVIDWMLTNNVYDPLVYPAMDGSGTEMKPHLAESIDIDSTGTVYTIKLRPSVKFHSGNSLTADDVVFSMNRMTALNVGPSFLFAGWVKSVRAVDPQTVEFTLTSPYAVFTATLSRLMIVDSQTVMANKQDGPFGEFGDYGAAWLSRNGAGSGAYSVAFHKKDERAELKKFGDYFLPVSEKAPDTVRIFFGQKDQTVVALFRRKQVDLAGSFFTADTKRQLLNEPGVSIANEPGQGLYFMKPNNTKPPFDDVHCRRALASALDYDSIMQVEQITPEIPGARPARGPLPSWYSSFPENLPEIRQDMDLARAELAKCKYEPGEHRIQFTFFSTINKFQRFALIAQHSWKQLGFETDIEPRLFAQYTAEVKNPEKAPMVGQLITFARLPDSDAFLYNTFHSSRHGQYLAAEYFADEKVDELLEKGRLLPIGPERDAIYGEAVTRIEELKGTFIGFEAINTYAKRDTFVWPNLELPNRNTGMIGGNHIFRLMEMNERS